jgi:probable HAF family extracellular repeat protein
MILARPERRQNALASSDAFFTSANGINNRGQIVGTFHDASGEHGFLDTGGSFTTIDVPGALFPGTLARGINDNGQIVGYFTVPGAFFTEAFGINDSGKIVGLESDGSRFHGFLDTGASFTIIDVPGAIDTFAYGVNNSGQIVGVNETYSSGFLATPAPVPEPPSSLTLAPCLVALFAMVWCRKRARGC